MATTYVVYQPTMQGPEAINSGTTISRHRTPGAAARKIQESNLRLRRQAGQQSSWLDWHIAAEERGERRELTAAEHHAVVQVSR